MCPSAPSWVTWEADSFKEGPEEDPPAGPGCGFSIWPIRTQWDQWCSKITWSLWSEKVTMVQDSQKKPQGFRTKLCLLQPGPFFFWRRRTWLAPGALIETRWLWNISCSSCTECYLIYPAVKSSIFKWKQYIGECIWAGPESSSFIRWWLLTMPTHATCPFSTSQTCNIMNTSPVSANWKKKKTKM